MKELASIFVAVIAAAVLVPIIGTISSSCADEIPTVNGRYVDETDEQGGTIVRIWQTLSGTGLIRRRTLWLELDSGARVICYLSGGGNVILRNASRLNDELGFDVDVTASEKWLHCARRPFTDFQNTLYEMNLRGRLTRYNLIDRNCAVFTRELYDNFYVADPHCIANPSMPLQTTAAVVVPPLPPTVTPALRTFSALPLGWIDGSVTSPI